VAVSFLSRKKVIQEKRGREMLCVDLGPRDAKIMLVGECPFEDDERYGQPFSGPEGRLLKQMLGHSGIDYSRCYVTNVMNTRPPGGKFSYFYNDNMPTPSLEIGWRALQEKVEAIKPDVVILFGNEALVALCNKRGISDWRGCWTSYKGINVMPTYTPDYILKVYGDHPIVEMDLVKAATQKPEKPCSTVVMPSLSEVVRCVEEMRTKASRIAFDIENIQKNIRSIGFAGANPFNTGCNKAVSAISIPFMKVSGSNSLCANRVLLPSTSINTIGSYWNVDEEIVVLDAIQRLLDSGIEIIGHNSISFDERMILKEFGLTVKNSYMDTMHAWHNLYPEFPMGLDFLCSVLTNYPNYWTARNRSSDREDAEYNGMDCIVTLEASYKIEQESREAELPNNSTAVI
jgi:uracil-DNA glycosylase family 4